MSIDRIGKSPSTLPLPSPSDVKGSTSPPSSTGAPGISGTSGPSSTSPVSSTSGAAGASATDAAQSGAPVSPAEQVRSGQLTLDAYIDLRVNEATQHLASRLGPGDLDRVRGILRDQLAADPALRELVERATGQLPALPES